MPSDPLEGRANYVIWLERFLMILNDSCYGPDTVHAMGGAFSTQFSPVHELNIQALTIEG